VNRFQFVADHQQRYGVKRLCTIIGLARSSFYYWQATASVRAERDADDLALAGGSACRTPRRTAPTARLG
jgi:hypothetical protein